jgi:peptide/nickel transport system permease protein
MKNPLGVVGLVIVILLLFTAAFAPWLATHDPYFPILSDRLAAPGAEYWFGADELGRDIYSRVVHGSRLTLLIVALVIVTSAPVGLIIGAVAGTYGGWIDRAFMRITDVFLAVPKLLLALAFVAALGPGIVNAALAITLTAWPPYARLARAEALVVRNSDYVNAIRLAGASNVRIIVLHVMPMCLSSVIVRMTFDMAGIILTAAGLGFIGLGAQPPLPEWGAMISTGRKFIFEQWWVATVPGIAIFVVSLGFNLLGDALRDLLDPHLRLRN